MYNLKEFRSALDQRRATYGFSHEFEKEKGIHDCCLTINWPEGGQSIFDTTISDEDFVSPMDALTDLIELTGLTHTPDWKKMREEIMEAANRLIPPDNIHIDDDSSKETAPTKPAVEIEEEEVEESAPKKTEESSEVIDYLYVNSVDKLKIYAIKEGMPDIYMPENYYGRNTAAKWRGFIGAWQTGTIIDWLKARFHDLKAQGKEGWDKGPEEVLIACGIIDPKPATGILTSSITAEYVEGQLAKNGLTLTDARESLLKLSYEEGWEQIPFPLDNVPWEIDADVLEKLVTDINIDLEELTRLAKDNVPEEIIEKIEEETIAMEKKEEVIKAVKENLGDKVKVAKEVNPPKPGQKKKSVEVEEQIVEEQKAGEIKPDTSFDSKAAPDEVQKLLTRIEKETSIENRDGTLVRSLMSFESGDTSVFRQRFLAKEMEEGNYISKFAYFNQATAESIHEYLSTE